MQHTPEFSRRRLLNRSAVDEASPLVNGCHCRMWTGKSLRGGYARMWDGVRLVDAHRLSFQVFKGPIPEGTEVTHDCDRPGCIEPSHLTAKSHAENIADIDRRGRRPPPKRGMLGRAGVRGAAHPKAKITEEIARVFLDRSLPRAALAEKYGVSTSLVDSVRRRTGWAWIRK